MPDSASVKPILHELATWMRASAEGRKPRIEDAEERFAAALESYIDARVEQRLAQRLNKAQTAAPGDDSHDAEPWTLPGPQ